MARLAWHPTFYRIRPGAVGDAAAGVDWQNCAHPRLEKREILRTHRRERSADARSPADAGPVVVKVGERPLHGKLARLDGFQPRTRPQVAHRVDARRVGTRRGWNGNAQRT